MMHVVLFSRHFSVYLGHSKSTPAESYGNRNTVTGLLFWRCRILTGKQIQGGNGHTSSSVVDQYTTFAFHTCCSLIQPVANMTSSLIFAPRLNKLGHSQTASTHHQIKRSLTLFNLRKFGQLTWRSCASICSLLLQNTMLPLDTVSYACRCHFFVTEYQTDTHAFSILRILTVTMS